MSELQFCKQFLSALDSRPIKLSSDHIADPRQYQPGVSFTLPRLPHPPHPARPNPRPSQSTTATSQQDATTTPSTINITLSPMKPTSPTVPVPNITPSTTSIFDLKQAYSTASSIPAAKIKILWKKKPAQDSKTVAEVVGQDIEGGNVEFSVMVLGGATASAAAPAAVPSPPAVAPGEAEKGLAAGVPAVQGPNGKEVVATQEFWDDLRGFVIQRIRNEEEGSRLAGVFKAAWEKDR
ncbi:uncharacterized protein EI97DRAFT_495803 [Westerdykella ornata]|uniref:Ubiquitin-like domain-containing protein n=1 Tax=Westerdykella ornata TaxID=318751 RepID=A0A6A6JB98_WESOR|nr:uncharacterized protein EI97DRAFT_495803 [Westerdykella ornata]KAF2273871.1 hypothetical protein EI97DRAFT_495803 [Westerdykella ornata]